MATRLDITNLVAELEKRGQNEQGIGDLAVLYAADRLLKSNVEPFKAQTVFDSAGAFPVPNPALRGLLATVENYTTDSGDNGLYLCTGSLWHKIQDLY